MQKLIMLGTGNATVTKCYNTCFAIREQDSVFLVDTGGGNGILAQLEKANIKLEQIHEIFISHEHTDHLLGLLWLIRMIATKMKKNEYEGNLTIYCHKELVETTMIICKLTIQEKFYKMIGGKILFVEITDGKKEFVQNGMELTFFDIASTKAKQYGFMAKLKDGGNFTFLGDEPYHDHLNKYASNAKWLLHEAFCLYAEKDIFKPYEKHHATVKEACEVGENMHAENLILYHTEDLQLAKRKERYILEGKAYYFGNLLVPNDLEEFIL